MAEAVFTNVRDMYFAKPYIAFKRENGTGYDAGVAVAKSLSAEDTLDLVEQMGPEADTPVGVGVGRRSCTFNGEHGIFDIELLSSLRGGQAIFTAGNNRTVHQAYSNDRVPRFDMRVRSNSSGNEIEAFFYNCIMVSLPIINLQDHQFVTSAFSGNVYGRSIDDGQLFYETSAPGNKTSSS